MNSNYINFQLNLYLAYIQNINSKIAKLISQSHPFLICCTISKNIIPHYLSYKSFLLYSLNDYLILIFLFLDRMIETNIIVICCYKLIDTILFIEMWIFLTN